MPEIIGSKHDSIVKVMVDGGEQRVMNSFRTAFGLTKEGFIFPLKIFVCLHFE